MVIFNETHTINASNFTCLEAKEIQGNERFNLQIFKITWGSTWNHTNCFILIYYSNFTRKLNCIDSCANLNGAVPNYNEFYRLNHSRIYEDRRKNIFFIYFQQLKICFLIQAEGELGYTREHRFYTLEFDVKIYYNFKTKNWQTRPGTWR